MTPEQERYFRRDQEHAMRELVERVYGQCGPAWFQPPPQVPYDIVHTLEPGVFIHQKPDGSLHDPRRMK